MSTYIGRHRSFSSEPSTFAPLRTATRPGLILLATGALVSAFALPAQSVTVPLAAASPLAGPATAGAASRTPSVTAPEAAAPLAQSFGVIGVKAVAKPKPKPKPVVVAARTVATTVAATTHTSQSTAPSGGNPAAPSTPSTPPTPAHGGVLAIAASLLGIPYVYGGSTPAGFDCSGFTMYVFARAGISLPRTAAGQQAASTPVSNPQPGDLVFFGYPAYHVGIYAGNGMMYDSPHTGAVTTYRAIWGGANYGRP